MTGVDYPGLLKLAAPETVLVVAALAALFIDLGIMRAEPRRARSLMAAAITALGGLLALIWIAAVPAHADLQRGIFVVDPLTQLVKATLIVMTLATVLISLNAEFTEHVGEYFSLLWMASVGMMFLVSAEETLMLFVALELTSLSLYLLTGLNRRNLKSVEAALKYFLFGSVAAAFLLFGLSLLYGVAGSTNLRAIATVAGARPLDPLFLLAMIMVVMGFGFKVAVVPFHLWAPDAYEGAPTPATALIASGSKVASFFILAKVLALAFAGAEGSAAWHKLLPGWTPLLATLAVASLLLGNLAALAQRNVKRLLAYSAIAHSGYVLIGLLAVADPATRSVAFAAVIYYVVTYGFTTIGALAVISAMEGQGSGSDLVDFAGLGQRAPGTAFCLLVFLLSLAGIPPLAGFFGKFYLFTAAAMVGGGSLGLLWLVILAIAMSTVGLYYYLQVLKRAYVARPAEGARIIAVPRMERLTLWGLALVVILLGVLPMLLLEPLAKAIKAAGF